jgi:hypothetical protein
MALILIGASINKRKRKKYISHLMAIENESIRCTYGQRDSLRQFLLSVCILKNNGDIQRLPQAKKARFKVYFIFHTYYYLVTSYQV